MNKLAKKEDKLPVKQLDEIAEAGEKYQEQMAKEDMSIPFVQILQQLSPQCTKGKPEFIKGAEPSDLLNTVTQEIWKTRDEDDNPIPALTILPVHYKRSHIEWVTRANGGGFVREYTVAEALNIITQRNDANMDIIQKNSPLGTPGNQLNDTHTHFVFVIEDDSFFPAVLTMSSTQIKSSKDLNAMIDKQRLPDGRRAPRFFSTWNITTQQRTNDMGSWYVWKFEKAGDVVSRMELFREARAFVEGIKTGENHADYSKMESVSDTETSDDIPF